MASIELAHSGSYIVQPPKIFYLNCTCLLCRRPVALLWKKHSLPVTDSILGQVDHLVYAVPDMESSVDDLERRLGVRATPGGQHQGRGTYNSLLALGPMSYLEIVAPDPRQPKPRTARWFRVDDLQSPRLVSWAVKGFSLNTLIANAAQSGVQLGPLRSGSRVRPDGVVVSWQCTDPTTVVADGLIPFFIDWKTSPHPAETAARGASLIKLRAEHPACKQVRDQLLAIGIDIPVDHGPNPALVATLQTGRGLAEIR